jgi:flagellar L-ring protein precursor FlgH
MSGREIRRAAPGGAPRALLLCAGALASTGCVEFALREAVRPTVYEIPTPAAPPAPSPGAIWTGGSAAGSFLYYDRKARGLGDLVTVVIRESLAAQGSANTALEKSSTLNADASSDLGFVDGVQDVSGKLFRLLGIGTDRVVAAPGASLNAIDANQGSSFEGDGSTQRRSTMTGTLTCRVVELLPGDVFRIQGRRQILVNHELQLVTVEGLVRRQDIAIDNSVASTQLADVKLTFDGIGVIDDKQRPPLLGRVLDWVLPF